MHLYPAHLGVFRAHSRSQSDFVPKDGARTARVATISHSGGPRTGPIAFALGVQRGAHALSAKRMTFYCAPSLPDSEGSLSCPHGGNV